MNHTKSIMELQQKFERTLAKTRAHDALCRVMVVWLAVHSPAWQPVLAEIREACAYELRSDNSLSQDAVEAAEDVLNETLGDIRQSIISAARCGILPAEA